MFKGSLSETPETHFSRFQIIETLRLLFRYRQRLKVAL